MLLEDGGDWRMADVIWLDGGARNPKGLALLQVADGDTGVINWGDAHLITHIVLRYGTARVGLWRCDPCDQDHSCG